MSVLHNSQSNTPKHVILVLLSLLSQLSQQSRETSQSTHFLECKQTKVRKNEDSDEIEIVQQLVRKNILDVHKCWNDHFDHFHCENENGFDNEHGLKMGFENENEF